MGTRSTTVIYESSDATTEPGKPLLTIYRQFDGYPEGHGAKMASFLANKTLVNGYDEDGLTQFNGMGDLAARLVTFLKEETLSPFDDVEKASDNIGNIYIVPFEHVGESWEEFLYEVHGTPGEEARIICTDSMSVLLVDAPASEFIASIPTEEEE